MSVKLRTGAGWMGWPPPLTQPPGQAMISMKSYCASPLRTISSTLPALAVPLTTDAQGHARDLIGGLLDALGAAHVGEFHRLHGLAGEGFHGGAQGGLHHAAGGAEDGPAPEASPMAGRILRPADR